MGIEFRFWLRIAKTLDGCWEWTGGCDKDGYGQLKVRRHGKITTMRAHHMAFTLMGRSIPNGMQLDHLCRNRCCVRPEHLELVSGAENNARSGSPSAVNARKTHCIRGHEFNQSNTRVDKNGHRRCKICDNENRKTPERRAVHAAYMRNWKKPR
jgi:hypothetical protein